jgi:hypothetical protein
MKTILRCLLMSLHWDIKYTSGKYNLLSMMKYAVRISCTFVIITLLFIQVGCEKWNETEEVSHVSYLPRFEIVGGGFLSYIVSEDAPEYTDPGAIAFENDKEIIVYAYGSVDLKKVGVYSVFYYAENSDGLFSIGERIIAVANKDVSDNDLSGKYIGTLWSPLTEMKVEKVNEKGLYKCSEVMGYPGTEMKGKFVDLGNNDLVLIHGDGGFGAFASSEGAYTLSSLSWTIALQDEPYTGIEIPVTWVKLDE